MSASQKWLIQGGIFLILLGLVYGLAHTFLVQHGTLPVLRESYREAFTAAAQGQLERSQASLEQAKKMNYRYVRVIDVHTHVIKLATLLILIGLLYPQVSWGKRTKSLLAMGFVTGTWLFPAGVFAEIFSTSTFPKALAAGGALLAIGSFALILLGIARGIRQ